MVRKRATVRVLIVFSLLISVGQAENPRFKRQLWPWRFPRSPILQPNLGSPVPATLQNGMQLMPVRLQRGMRLVPAPTPSTTGMETAVPVASPGASFMDGPQKMPKKPMFMLYRGRPYIAGYWVQHGFMVNSVTMHSADPPVVVSDDYPTDPQYETVTGNKNGQKGFSTKKFEHSKSPSTDNFTTTKDTTDDELKKAKEPEEQVEGEKHDFETEPFKEPQKSDDSAVKNTQLANYQYEPHTTESDEKETLESSDNTPPPPVVASYERDEKRGVVANLKKEASKLQSATSSTAGQVTSTLRPRKSALRNQTANNRVSSNNRPTWGIKNRWDKEYKRHRFNRHGTEVGGGNNRRRTGTRRPTRRPEKMGKTQTTTEKSWKIPNAPYRIGPTPLSTVASFATPMPDQNHPQNKTLVHPAWTVDPTSTGETNGPGSSNAGVSEGRTSFRTNEPYYFSSQTEDLNSKELEAHPTSPSGTSISEEFSSEEQSAKLQNSGPVIFDYSNEQQRTSVEGEAVTDYYSYEANDQVQHNQSGIIDDLTTDTTSQKASEETVESTTPNTKKNKDICVFRDGLLQNDHIDGIQIKDDQRELIDFGEEVLRRQENKMLYPKLRRAARSMGIFPSLQTLLVQVMHGIANLGCAISRYIP